MQPAVRAPLSWARHSALGAAAVAPGVAVAFMHPVVKGPTFHHYADGRTLFGLPHAGDVLSNLPFVIVGVLGLLAARQVVTLPRRLVALFFASVLAIGLGSAAYHVHPMDSTLVFDWLPIILTLAFLTALILADRVDARVGRIAAVVLPIVAVSSVLWWWAGGGTEGGDMRWYGFLQLLLIAGVPLVILLYPDGNLPRRELFLGVGCFLAARAVHAADARILHLTGVSGHTLKHLFAGLATYCVLRAVRRQPAIETV